MDDIKQDQLPPPGVVVCSTEVCLYRYEPYKEGSWIAQRVPGGGRWQRLTKGGTWELCRAPRHWEIYNGPIKSRN